MQRAKLSQVARPQWSTRLAALRTLSNKTQSVVAHHLGISQQKYASYESGKAEPDVAMWIKLAKLFRTTVDYIMGGDGSH